MERAYCLSGKKENCGEGTRTETWGHEIDAAAGPSRSWDDQVKPCEQKLLRVPDTPNKKNEATGNE